MSEPYKDWIVRFYASHNDIPEGHADGGIVGELVRCKDCVNCGTDDCAMHFETDDKVYQWNRADDFCSLAERKEHGNDV